MIAVLPLGDRGREPATSLPVVTFTGRRSRSKDAGGGFMRRVESDGDRQAQTVRTLRGLLDSNHARGGQIAANTRDRMGR